MSGAPRKVEPEAISARILVSRGQRVLLDADLAELYGVTTKRLNEQVRRNARRFPTDFVFHLEINEIRALRSQFATLDRGRGRHRKYAGMAFTEHGAIMAATVLNDRRGHPRSSAGMNCLYSLHGAIRVKLLDRADNLHP